MPHAATCKYLQCCTRAVVYITWVGRYSHIRRLYEVEHSKAPVVRFNYIASFNPLTRTCHYSGLCVLIFRTRICHYSGNNHPLLNKLP